MVTGMETETGKMETGEKPVTEYVIKYEVEGVHVYTEIVRADVVNEREFLKKLQEMSIPHWLEPELESTLERAMRQLERALTAVRHARGVKDALQDILADGELERVQRLTLAALNGCTAKVWKVKRKGDDERRKLLLVIKYMPLWTMWWQK